MATKVVGKLDSWDDGDLGESDYVKLEEGSNVMRILTAPFQFYNHWTNDESGQQRKVRCALENCPVCQRGEKASARWFVGVLVRKTGKPGVLEMGPQIFKQIKGLKAKKAWGDPRTYDLDVERQPKGSQPLYVTTPENKEPLTKEEIVMVKKFIEECDLAKMVEAPTPDEVREKLGLAPGSTSDSGDFDFDSGSGTDSDNSEDDFKFED